MEWQLRVCPAFSLLRGLPSPDQRLQVTFNINPYHLYTKLPDRNCFFNETLFDGSPLEVDQGLCDDYLCQNDNYNQLLACLECILANGGEEPLDIAGNPALTAAPSGSEPIDLNPASGYLNQSSANEWLANVVDRCEGIGRALEAATTTVTASPTTTFVIGPAALCSC